MKKFTNLIARLIPALLFVFLFISPTQAFYTQTGDVLVLPKDKKINEAAFVAGSSLTIDSDINGDLFCAGRDIIVNGNIKGDIICASQTIKINGTVDGDVRVLAQSIEVSGQINRNLTAAAQSIILGPKSNIKGDTFFGVQNIELGGLMGRDLAGAGESVVISGSLLRNAVVTGTNLSIIENSKIGGNLDYYMEKSATASVDKKNVKGTILRHEIETPNKDEMKNRMSKSSGMAMASKTLFGILSFIVLGYALIHFDRKNIENRIKRITDKPLISGLIGIAVLVTAPVIFITLMITVVGIPFAFVALFVFIIALITASLYPSAIFGKVFIEKVLQRQAPSLFWQMATGVVLLGLVSCIPIIGWAISFASFCVGLGAYFTSLFPEKA